MATSKFDPFDKVDLTFKIVNGHPLEASILTPKTLQSRSVAEYPILVYWHGGGFIVGHRMYEGWFAPWLLDLCLTTPCILITPDYRLLPEANASDILTDVESFWTWLHNTLPVLSNSWHARPDLSKLACAGTSAGGYLAVQSAFLYPDLSRIKLLISIAGSLHSDIPHYRIPGPKKILGKRPPPPWKAERILREYVKGIKDGSVVTRRDPVESWEFLTCVLQQAYLPRWLGMKSEKRLDVMGNLERAEDVPPVWILQGDKDSVVPPICSTGFVDKLKQVKPDVPVLLSLQHGDHGFEVMHTVDDEWVREGFEFVKKYWP